VSLWANVPAGPTLPTEGVVDAVVVGGGPAGYTAAIYLARARTEPVVLAGTAPGGQLMDTGIVENFPGFPDGVDGPELMARMREQAERAGASVFTVDADAIEYADGPAPVHRITTSTGIVRARAIVVATGSAPRRLGVPGEAELGAGLGVAYCAVCEAPLFQGRDVAVVGGGDSAMEEVLALARHARRVHLLHRRDSFRAAPVMLDRVRSLGNVEIHTDAVVTAAVAGPDGRLAAVTLADGGSLAVQGLFVAIGHVPRTELLPPQPMPGVFVAGDVADDRFRQAVTAAGAGCAAALEVSRYLEEGHA
jgi:thioredoxin reductase (NADPH)